MRTVTFSQFDVVRVPFPFPDRASSKNRPALILSNAARFGITVGHSVMAMITSAEHRPWPLDHRIADLEAAGLPAVSVVRFKLFTLDHRLFRGTLGRLAQTDSAAVMHQMRRLFDCPHEPREAFSPL